MGVYSILTIFSHTFSVTVSLFSINKTKKKEHCTNSIPSIYDFFWLEEGEVGACSRLGGYYKINLFGLRSVRFFRSGILGARRLLE